MKLSTWYSKSVALLLMLLPAIGTLFIRVAANPEQAFWYGPFHQIAVLSAIAISGGLGYAAFRSYQKELDPSLRFIAMGYYGFAMIYALHGLFTPIAHDHILLFLVFGPVSRLVMCVYVYLGLMRLMNGPRRDDRRVARSWWLAHLAVLAALCILAGYAAHAGWLSLPRVKLVEGLSVALSLLGVIRLVLLRRRSTLLRYHLVAQAFFAQSSLSFLLSLPWNALWWFAHAVSAAAFLVLGFAIMRSYEATRSLGSVYEETLLYPVLNSILHASHEGIIMTDLQGRVSFTNHRIEHFFPGSLDRGRPIGEFVSGIKLRSAGGEKPTTLVEELLDGKREQLALHVEMSGGGGADTLFYELYAGPVNEERRGTIGYLFVFRNRTEEERLNQLKNDFIGIVSHELRTPMSSILGFTEIMMTRNVAPEKRAKYLETVYNEANRLSNLINDFLDIQRIEAGRQKYRFEPVDLSEALREVAGQWEGKDGHTLRLALPEGPVPAIADTERLVQVLHNLISNAVKYSPGAEYVDLSVRQDGEEAVMEIRDYGLGIPEESLPRLFHKFYRVESSSHRKIRGTGLGLAIVKEIVEAHNGTVGVESEPGKGTVFSVRLPLYPIPDLEGKLAILEDDEGQGQLIQEALDGHFGSIVRFTSAEEALFVLERTARLPWLWIVDIQLEGVLDGWSFIKRLKGHPLYRETSLVISTVSTQPSGYRCDENEGYLRKPYAVNGLLELVDRLRREPGNGQLLVPSYDEQAFIELLHKQGMEISGIDRSDVVSRIRLKRNGES